mgnify:CR=1 FL=1
MDQSEALKPSVVLTEESLRPVVDWAMRAHQLDLDVRLVEPGPVVEARITYPQTGVEWSCSRDLRGLNLQPADIIKSLMAAMNEWVRREMLPASPCERVRS